MKKEVFESLRNGEISTSLYDKRKPLPDEIIIMIEENCSDFRVIEHVSVSQAVKEFNDADENSCISFTIPRYVSWYARKNDLNIVASSVAKLM